jgi:hypothetical protein
MGNTSCTSDSCGGSSYPNSYHTLERKLSTYFLISDWSFWFDRGYVDDMLSLVSIDSWSFSQNFDVNWDPLSDTIFLGTPCRHTIRDIYNSVRVALDYIILTGMKWATLVNLSTITNIESYPACVLGNLSMKSTLIYSHFHSGIFNGCNNLAGLWCSALTQRHVSHNDTYSAISWFLSYHNI